MRYAYASGVCSCISNECLTKGFSSILKDNYPRSDYDKRFETAIEKGSMYTSLRNALIKNVATALESRSMEEISVYGVDFSFDDIKTMFDSAIKEKMKKIKVMMIGWLEENYFLYTMKYLQGM